MTKQPKTQLISSDEVQSKYDILNDTRHIIIIIDLYTK